MATKDTKTRFLDAALRIYARDPEQLNVHAIVAESGASLGSLYHHFGNMDGLCAALYARCMGNLLEAIARALETARSARSGTFALVRTYLEFARTSPAAARFIHASAYASFVPAHASDIALSKSQPLARIRAFFMRHVRTGALVQLNETYLEMLLIGPVAEVTRRYLGGEPFDLQQAAEVLAPRVWRSVARAAQTTRA
ncbi:MAG TPA: TetR/AcrR family transcriptional regulator [Polyangiales bacterium]